MIKLFVEKPRDNFGYRIYNVAIIEGIECEESNMIEILAPENFGCSLVNRNGWQELRNEAGPARIPTSQETNNDANKWRDEMIKKFGVGN